MHARSTVGGWWCRVRAGDVRLGNRLLRPPPVYLHAVIERTGWPLRLGVDGGDGALPVRRAGGREAAALHARFGSPPHQGRCRRARARGARLGAVREPWQLMVAALLSGGGWVTMGAVAVNAVIAPWFVRTRPAALAKAYNGASIGGVVFSPLWVALIAAWAFAHAARRSAWSWSPSRCGCSAVLSRDAAALGQTADGDRARTPSLSDAALRPTRCRARCCGATADFRRWPPAWRSGCSRRSACWRICSRCWCRCWARRAPVGHGVGDRVRDRGAHACRLADAGGRRSAHRGGDRYACRASASLLFCAAGREPWRCSCSASRCSARASAMPRRCRR